MSEKKHICFVIKYSPAQVLGGAQKQAYIFAKQLACRGWKVSYICEDHKNLFPNDFPQDNIHFMRIPATKRDFQPLFNFFHLYKAMREVDADIYYQRISSLYTGMVCLFCKVLGKKFVWANASLSDCDGRFHRRYIAGDYRLRSRYPYFLFLDMFYYTGGRFSDLIISQTNDQKRMLRQHFPHKNIVVVPNAYYVKAFQPELDREPKWKEPKTIIWVTHYKKDKHPEDFIRLAQRCQDLNVQFVMVGKYPDKNQERAAFEAEIKQLNNLVHLGPQPQSRVYRAMKEAYLLVCTGGGAEGFPNVFIEAWMLRKPTLSLYFDPDNIIKRNRIGFHAGSINKLDYYIRRLASDEALYRSMAKRAYTFASNQFDPNRATDQLDYHLKKLLS